MNLAPTVSAPARMTARDALALLDNQDHELTRLQSIEIAAMLRELVGATRNATVEITAMVRHLPLRSEVDARIVHAWMQIVKRCEAAMGGAV